MTLPTDYDARKAIPIVSGVLDYFPDAIAEVARVSKAGGDQHNPGKPLFWDRTKSQDEANTLLRHFLERGGVDTDGMLHSAKLVWRALALLQKELEARHGYPLPRGCTPPVAPEPASMVAPVEWVPGPGDHVTATGPDYHDMQGEGEVFDGFVTEGPDSDGHYRVVENGGYMRSRWFTRAQLALALRSEPNPAPSSDP